MEQKIIHGEAIEELKKMGSNSVDAIITDPPYNVLAVDWDKQEINWEELCKEYYRVLKVNGCVYVFGQFPMINNVFFELNKHLKFKQDLVWYKNRGFSLVKTIFTKYHENILFFTKDNEEILKEFAKEIKKRRKEKRLTTRRCRELCSLRIYENCGNAGYLWYETGNCPSLKVYNKIKEIFDLDNTYDCLFDRPTFNFEDIKLEGEPYKITRKEQKVYGLKSNMKEFTRVNEGKRNPKTVLEYSIIQGGKEYFGHPTQKPVELLKYLISSCTNEGDVVLDTFAGSFSTLKACQEINRKGIGIELEEKYVEIGRKRLNQQSLNFEDNKWARMAKIDLNSLNTSHKNKMEEIKR